MLSNTLYPWLEEYWQTIESLKRQSRLPHALMLRGDEGLALDNLAMTIAHSLLCSEAENSQAENEGNNKGNMACGHCSNCQLLAAGTHPDFHLIEIPEDKKGISVNQIRDLVNVCVERPHQGGYRIAVITPSNAMTNAAANALLKTLEEPGEDTLILLVANLSQTLPATVRSRCQLMTVNAPSEEKAYEWLVQHCDEDQRHVKLALGLSNQSPLRALELLKSRQLDLRQTFLASMEQAANGLLDPTKLVASIKKFEHPQTVDWMYSLALDALKLNHGIDSQCLVNRDQTHLLQKIVASNQSRLTCWIDKIFEARRLFSTTSNINPQLIVEDLMFRWIAIFR